MTRIPAFSVDEIRAQFPVLQRSVSGHPLVYLDNAATTQKPQAMIDALAHYYSQCNSNVHRGAHHLADQATRRFEGARDTLARFINARCREEVIWTKGTTESINLVANGFTKWLGPGDEVLVSAMEHHANLIPWQQACKTSGAKLKIAPINDAGDLDLDAFAALLNAKTRLVAFPHVSNALGTVNPINQLTRMAKGVGALVLIDGAQAVAHAAVDVQAIGCDFYAFSGHKLFGPTGIGVLWGRRSLLADWPVWQTGGEMIASVSYEHADWNELPYRLEAGTPNIAGAIGLAAAVEWFQSLDQQSLRRHEAQLLDLATATIGSIPGVKIIGTAAEKAGVLSFVAEQGHATDIGFLLDRQGVAIRTGHHCAEPLMDRLNIAGTARASFSIYNTEAEVERFAELLRKALSMLGKV